MSRVLDIDMDFFLNRIATEKSDDVRLDENMYTPWNEKDLCLFLEQKCKLSKSNKVRGRIIKHHDEAFYFWDELIKKGLIDIPFEVTHIDAHTDLKAGYPSDALNYMLGDLLHLPISKRLHDMKHAKLGPANFLAFAIACGFFNKVDLVVHPDYQYCDLPTPFFKNYDINSNLEMKAYSSSSLALGNLNNPLNIDPEIPFKIITPDKFVSPETYNYVVFCQSPGYTPQTADFMIEVIKEYITEV